ncbi:MAG: hypothetical protein NTW72_12950 [Gemmatimonadetes bacterium]|nr:hypothetical protein [Gemmatimonadota bacterium]
MKHDVPFSEDLSAWLSEVNANRLRIGHAYERDDGILHAIEDFGDPLVVEHLLDALAAASTVVPVRARAAGLWIPE